LKTTPILSALAFVLCAGPAGALPLPLQNASITATYNGAADTMLGLDHGFAQEAGSNTSTLDPTDTGVEFFTSDFLVGIDFSASGALTVIANGVVAPGAASMRFDFGNSLALPISTFAWTGAAGVSGVPGLTIIDGHTIALELGALSWSEFGTLSAQLDTAAPVPEPGIPASVAAGFAALVLTRRLRRERQQ
jgi:hypothetical protein